ncbi:MAG: glycyl radical protein [Eubacterium sp.]|nr:glycyl radical protein [Eubacterium sp.]
MATLTLSPQEKRLEATKGKVVFRTQRTQRIYDSFQGTKSAVDIQRAKYFTESFRQTEGQALSLRWAKALYHIAESIDVIINDDELLVGRVGKAGKYGLVYPELDGCFLKEFALQSKSREQSPFEIADEDIAVIENEIEPYWHGKTYYEDLARSLPDDILKLTYEPEDLFTSRFIVNETSSMRSALQWVHDYARGINDGFEAIKKEAQEKLATLDEYNPADTVDKADFLNSIIIVCDAIMLWAERYAELAEQLAEKEENPQRKAELLQIAENCRTVPRYPAKTFWQAMQAQWFIQMFSRLEQKTGTTISNGRMDEYLYPYYKRDLENGQITKEDAKQLFECMWLGMAQYQDLYISPAGAKFSEGYAHWEAVTIGGVDKEGNDITNDISYILLENKREFPLNYPDLAARIHHNSPEAFLKEIAITVKDGSGFPKLINDEEVLPILLSRGADIASAREYAVSGCTEVRMPNLDTFTTPCPYLNLGAVVELTLYNGRMKKYGSELLTLETGNFEDFDTFDEFLQAFRQQLDYILKTAFRQQYIANRLHARHFAAPMGSALHELCMKNCQDLHSEHIDGGIDIGYFDFIGLGTAADCLAAIQKTVFEDKTVTKEELTAALDSNFDGFEAVRQRLMHAPAYGNADEYADHFAKLIDRIGIEFTHRYAKHLGINMDLRYVSQSSNVPFGKVVAALPNGRTAGTPLSDGSSASQGRDINGPTSVLISNFNTKYTDFDNRASRLLNIKLSPSCVTGEAGTERIIQFIKTWRDLMLWHLQFNIINRETLLKARKHPENYKSLLVRVAGYSAYFVELSPDCQDDIIMRTEHDIA